MNKELNRARKAIKKRAQVRQKLIAAEESQHRALLELEKAFRTFSTQQEEAFLLLTENGYLLAEIEAEYLKQNPEEAPENEHDNS
jgi:hypothetical protein